MTAFRTLESLRASLDRAGLGLLTGPIVATARPTILFLRVQEFDDGLPPATSKIGGLPDLPETFAWPTRPPYPDAVKRAADALAFARDVAASREAQVMGPLQAHERLIPRAEIDRLIPAAEARGRAFASHFPLGFVGQIDLAALSKEAGFDAGLPNTGLLSVFEDITAEGQAGPQTLFWHDLPADRLKRTPPPADLVAHHDLCGSYGLGADEPWSKLTRAETLVPFSAFAVPYHWTSAFPRDSPTWRKLWDWFQSEERGDYAPQAPSFQDHGPDAPQAGFFGDRLGGWPNPIQGDPEEEVGSKVVRPGQTPWRHLFSFAGEFFGGTRRMGSDGKGDGTTYHLIEASDLGARHFDKARWTYQMD